MEILCGSRRHASNPFRGKALAGGENEVLCTEDVAPDGAFCLFLRGFLQIFRPERGLHTYRGTNEIQGRQNPHLIGLRSEATARTGPGPPHEPDPHLTLTLSHQNGRGNRRGNSKRRLLGSAGLQPAVSPTSSRQTAGKTEVVWKSRALRIGNSRHSRLEVCATTHGNRCGRVKIQVTRPAVPVKLRGVAYEKCIAGRGFPCRT